MRQKITDTELDISRSVITEVKRVDLITTFSSLMFFRNVLRQFIAYGRSDLLTLERSVALELDMSRAISLGERAITASWHAHFKQCHGDQVLDFNTQRRDK